MAGVPADGVKAHREERGWSQVVLANEAGISPATVYRAEAGLPIQRSLRLALARALGVDVDVLHGRDASDSPASAPEPAEAAR